MKFDNVLKATLDVFDHAWLGLSGRPLRPERKKADEVAFRRALASGYIATTFGTRIVRTDLNTPEAKAAIAELTKPK